MSWLSREKRLTLSIVCGLVFIVSFAWIFFLTQGLPIGDLDEWNHILTPQDRSWNDLLTNLSLPWSKSKYWTGQVDRSQPRIFQYVVHKLIHGAFGYKSLPYFLVGKALFFAGIITILFLLLVQLTNSIPIATGAALFFSLVPAHYLHTLWLADSVTIANFFIVTGVLLSLHLFRNFGRSGSYARFSSVLIAILIVGWIGIRTKESAVILPLLVGSYGLIQFFQGKSDPKKAILLFMAMSFLIFLIVPIEHLSENKPVGTVPFLWSTISRMLFRNFHCGYEDEPTTAFFSREQIWPVSIARTFGFYPLWTLVAFLILYWLGILLFRPPREVRFFSEPASVIACIWCVIEIMLLGRFQSDPRYFSGTMMPLTLLAARLISCVKEIWPRFWSRLFMMFPLFSVVWISLYVNIQHVLWYRLQIGWRNNVFLDVGHTIYRDRFPNQEIRPDLLGRFYCNSCAPDHNFKEKINNFVFHSELAYGGWNKTENGSIEDFKRYAADGAIYYVTFSKEKFLNEQNVALHTTISGINKESVFERLLLKIRPKKPPVIYIFKWGKTNG